MIYPPGGHRGGGVRPTLLRALTLMTGSVAADSNEQLPKTASLRQEVLPLSCRKCSGATPCLTNLCVFTDLHFKMIFCFSLFKPSAGDLKYAAACLTSGDGVFSEASSPPPWRQM